MLWFLKGSSRELHQVLRGSVVGGLVVVSYSSEQGAMLQGVPVSLLKGDEVLSLLPHGSYPVHCESIAAYLSEYPVAGVDEAGFYFKAATEFVELYGELLQGVDTPEVKSFMYYFGHISNLIEQPVTPDVLHALNVLGAHLRYFEDNFMKAGLLSKSH